MAERETFSVGKEIKKPQSKAENCLCHSTVNSSYNGYLRDVNFVRNSGVSARRELTVYWSPVTSILSETEQLKSYIFCRRVTCVT